MGNNDKQTPTTVDRRRFIQAAGATGTVALAGCSQNSSADGSDTPGDGDSSTEGDTAGSSGKDTVTLKWAADDDIVEVWDTVKKELRKAGLPDHIEVELVVGSSITDQRQDQFTQWLNSKRSEPDLFLMDSGWNQTFIARGQTENLEQHLSEDTIKGIKNEYFDPALWTATSQEGKLNAIPMWVGLPGMYYRKDLIKEAGYSPDSENWATEGITWKKFAKAISDTKAQNPDIDYGYTFQAMDYEGLSCCDFNEFMSSWGGAYFGGDLFGPIGDRSVTVDEEPVKKSIRMVRTFIHGQDDPVALDGYEGNISPDSVVQWDEQSSFQPFKSGNAIANRNWPGYIISAEETFGDKLGFMPIPYAVTEENAKYESRGGPVGALGGWNLTINPYSEKKEAAVEFVKATLSDDFHMNAIFSAVGDVPPKTSVLESEAAANVPKMGKHVETLSVIGQNAVPRPATAIWPPQSSAISGEVNAALAQKKTPAKAMSDLQGQLEEIESSY